MLLTQFGYANWVGNEAHETIATKAAELTMQEIETQLRILSPAYVIPFASFIWCSNKENRYWNKYAMQVNDPELLDVIDTFAELILMYPGDTYKVSGDNFNHLNITKWGDIYEARDHTCFKH